MVNELKPTPATVTDDPLRVQSTTGGGASVPLVHDTELILCSSPWAGLYFERATYTGPSPQGRYVREKVGSRPSCG